MMGLINVESLGAIATMPTSQGSDPRLAPRSQGARTDLAATSQGDESAETFGEMPAGGEINGTKLETAHPGPASLNGHSRSPSRAPVLSSLLAADRETLTSASVG